MSFVRVHIESPYGAKDREAAEGNLRYLRACMKHCLHRKEAPYASHGLYTQEGVLDDWDPEERKLGIEAGFAWRHGAVLTAVYCDLGISKGMVQGIKHATELNHPVEYRLLGGEWSKHVPLETVAEQLGHLIRELGLHPPTTDFLDRVRSQP